jgi:hypothetical protein
MMRQLPIAIIASMAVAGTAPTSHAACTPGGFFCAPSEQVVRDYLAQRYPDVAIDTLDFTYSRFGRPEDKTQRFRVDFKGEATLKTELLYDAKIEDIQSACGLSAPPALAVDVTIYKVVGKAGDRVSFAGDTAMRGENGAWVGTADLMNYKRPDGSDLFGLRPDWFKTNPIVLGKASGDEYCASLTQKTVQ